MKKLVLVFHSFSNMLKIETSFMTNDNTKYHFKAELSETFQAHHKVHKSWLHPVVIRRHNSAVIRHTSTLTGFVRQQWKI
jgi:hypothetical protein